MKVYFARHVVPITSAPISDGGVAVEDGRITWLGARADAPAGERIDLGNVVLAPGLVNVHTHLELTAMRGFLETHDFASWVATLTRARRDVMDDDALLRSARAGVREGVRAGITTFADTGASRGPIRAMREAGVRGIAFHEVFGPDPAHRDGAIAGLQESIALARAFESDRVTLGVSPHAPYSVSAELFTAVADLARRERLPVAIHCAESEAESRYVADGDGPFAEAQRRRGFTVRAHGLSPVAWLERTGILERRPLLIHCVRVDRRDIARIRAHDCAVAHCPASNAKLGHGAAPFLDFLAAGVRVGIGCDSVASNNRMDPLEEARFAAFLARAVARRHDVLDAAGVVALATIDGARALGLEADIGSLEPGKRADLAAFDLGSPRAIGVADPVSALAFSLTGADARFVAVAGEALMVDGVLGPMFGPADDLADISARLMRWRTGELEALASS